MASMKSRTDAKNSFYVAYKHPIKGKQKTYYNDKRNAVMALAHWNKIELLVKMELDWQSELVKEEQGITVQEIIDLHKNNVLANKTLNISSTYPIPSFISIHN